MIRRLSHDALLESIAPRSISGGRASPVVVPNDMPQSDELDTQAYRQGYAEGFQAGEQDGRREAEQFHRAWEEDTRARMDETRESLLLEHESLAALIGGLNEQLRMQGDAMEQLAFELALKSLAEVFGTMQKDGEMVRRLCAQMAEGYRGKAARLEVSAIDRPHLPEQIEGMVIAVEHGLSRGECRVVTEHGYAESSIAIRLDAIHGAMREALGLVNRP